MNDRCMVCNALALAGELDTYHGDVGAELLCH